jgi:hypothetical protein
MARTSPLPCCCSPYRDGEQPRTPCRQEVAPAGAPCPPPRRVLCCSAQPWWPRTLCSHLLCPAPSLFLFHIGQSAPLPPSPFFPMAEAELSHGAPCTVPCSHIGSAPPLSCTPAARASMAVATPLGALLTLSVAMADLHSTLVGAGPSP